MAGWDNFYADATWLTWGQRPPVTVTLERTLPHFVRAFATGARRNHPLEAVRACLAAEQSAASGTVVAL